MALGARWIVRRVLIRATAIPSFAWPSAAVARRPRRAPSNVRLFAIVAIRDEFPQLDGLLANIAPQVDGIVALDDGSTDGSAEHLAAHPAVLEVLSIDPSRPSWADVENHRRLVAAALQHGAEWIVSVDADERLERDFRARAERVIRRGARLGLDGYAVRFRELWDDDRHWRADGVWGAKTQARLFAARPDHAFDLRPFHGTKAPLQAARWGRVPVADLTIYHLGMVVPTDRAARRARYERLDPQAAAQPGLGYAYLTDERGLRRRRVGRRRGFTA